MKDIIRKITENDKEEYIKMAEEFYSSDAVSHSIPRKNFENAFEEAVKENPMIQLYIFDLNEKTAGYAALAVTYTTEGGGKTVWLDELYIKEAFRGKGLGRSFLQFLKSDESISRIRLEITPENESAQKLYLSEGFCLCDYKQMIFDRN